MKISYNPYKKDFYENPRALYKKLRDEAPVFWSEECNFWVLSRYEDVRTALADWKVFSSEAGAGAIGPAGELFKQTPNLQMFDPPRHTQLRKVLAGLITPDRMLDLSGHVRSRVVNLLTPMEGEKGFDLTQDFAEPMPMQVIADLLGIPQEDAPVLMKSVDRLADYRQEDLTRNAREALEDLRDYYAAYFRYRASKDPGGDIIWHLIEAARTGVLSQQEALGFAIIVTIAGAETTTKMIGNLALLLHKNPDQQALLAKSPDLTRSAIEEGLRYNSSTHMQTRTLTEDITMRGCTMHSGDVVAILLNSANNDERKYDNPEKFDIRRSSKGDYVAFGAGVHACIGSPLARLELLISIEEIMKRWPQFSIKEDGLVRYVNPFTSGFRHIPFLVS